MLTQQSDGVFVSFEGLETRLMMHRSITWGPEPALVGQDLAAAYFGRTTGVGESVAVLDTGIDYMHPAFGSGTGRHYTVLGGWNFINNNGDYMDYDGHGTAVAGVIAARTYYYNNHIYAGVAPGAALLALKIDDGVNDPPAARIAAALQWVLNNRTKYNIVAVNLSEGNTHFYNTKTSERPYGVLLQELHDAGVLVACSSGNNGNYNGVEYPSADPSSISVGSVNDSGKISGFTSTGDSLDMLAPGENVPMPTIDPNTHASVYVEASGTSFAAPYVAATAALIHQIRPGLSVDGELSLMQSTGTPVYDPYSRNTYSLVNVYRAISALTHASRVSRAVAVAVARSVVTPSLASTTPRSVFSTALIGDTDDSLLFA